MLSTRRECYLFLFNDSLHAPLKAQKILIYYIKSNTYHTFCGFFTNPGRPSQRIFLPSIEPTAIYFEDPTHAC